MAGEVLDDIKSKSWNVVSSVWQKGRDYAMATPDIEVKVRDATAEDTPGPSMTQMREIAAASFHYADYTIIAPYIWKRLQQREQTKIVYKTLLLIEFLIRNGSDDMVQDISMHSGHIESLTRFTVSMNVQKKAAEVLEILTDPRRLRDEREQARKNRDKYKGYGSDSYEGRRGGGGISYDSYSSDSYSSAGRDSYSSGRDSYSSGRDSYSSGRDSYSSGRDSYSSSRDSYSSGRTYGRDNDDYRGGNASRRNEFNEERADDNQYSRPRRESDESSGNGRERLDDYDAPQRIKLPTFDHPKKEKKEKKKRDEDVDLFSELRGQENGESKQKSNGGLLVSAREEEQDLFKEIRSNETKQREPDLFESLSPSPITVTPSPIATPVTPSPALPPSLLSPSVTPLTPKPSGPTPEFDSFVKFEGASGTEPKKEDFWSKHSNLINLSNLGTTPGAGGRSFPTGPATRPTGPNNVPVMTTSAWAGPRVAPTVTPATGAAPVYYPPGAYPPGAVVIGGPAMQTGYYGTAPPMYIVPSGRPTGI